jgi:hypothetical protein
MPQVEEDSRQTDSTFGDKTVQYIAGARIDARHGLQAEFTFL